jgi:hypothetical protein
MKCVEIYAEFDIKDGRQYRSAFDFAEVQWRDEPYLEFEDSEVTKDDTIIVSAVRKDYQYFKDNPPVDLMIVYEFKGMNGTLKAIIKGEDVYMAESWFIDELMHRFTGERNYFSNLKMYVEAYEVSA